MPTLQRIGRYRIVEHVATGGMGEVYRAVCDDAEGKVVALKVVRPDVADDPAVRGMFESEARVALALSHANVVQTFEVDRADGRLFFAMEHVDGLDLARILQALGARGEPLPLAHALLIAAEALQGLDYAHRSRGPGGEELRLVHRDISPGNILLSGEGEVKITDFGVALSNVRTHRSMVGVVKGKLGYMAPEQIEGAPVDFRADIYAMGTVLAEMLTGVRPYPGTTPAIIPDVLKGRFKKPRELRPGLPQMLEDIVLCAMAVKPDARFESAGEMSRVLLEAGVAMGLVLSTMELGRFVHEVRERAGVGSRRPGSDEEPTQSDRPRSRRPPPKTGTGEPGD